MKLFRHISTAIAAVILAVGAGCALPGSSKSVSIESDTSLSRQIKKDLLSFTSVQDVMSESPVSDELIRLSAGADEQNMVAYLRANSYFDASVRHRITEVKSQPHVVYEITTGPSYKVSELEIVWPAGYEGLRPVSTSELDRATSAAILSTRSALLRRLREQGYPSPRIARQHIVVDHETRLVHPTLEVDPGTEARFGDIKVDGLRKLSPGYIQKALTWKKGDQYDIRRIELLEHRLGISGLFSSIQTRRQEITDGSTDDIFDVQLTLRERKPRTVQFGVGYRTDTGAETTAQWQHRNVLGAGESILVRGRLSEEGQEAELRLTVPFFMRADQQWGASLKYRDESPDAYENRAWEAETWISRELNRHWLVRTGIALQYLDERQNDISENYFLVSMPNRISWDRTNDRLDATKGMRVIVLTEPFQGINDTTLFFWKNLVTVNGFQPLTRSQSLSLAIRLTGGTIRGTALDNIPADERFYAGGGQSVRGYAYQSLSPRSGDAIIGGLSVAESSLELRGRISDTIGAVVFIDGGGAFDEAVPDFKETYHWGTGAGFRYFTPVGPLRLDVGIPLDKRKGIDDSWQFYISIGQAF